MMLAQEGLSADDAVWLTSTTAGEEKQLLDALFFHRPESPGEQHQNPSTMSSSSSSDGGGADVVDDNTNPVRPGFREESAAKLKSEIADFFASENKPSHPLLRIAELSSRLKTADLRDPQLVSLVCRLLHAQYGLASVSDAVPPTTTFPLLDTKAAGGTRFQLAVLMDQLSVAPRGSNDLDAVLTALLRAINKRHPLGNVFAFADPFARGGVASVGGLLARRYGKLFVTICKTPFLEVDLDLYRSLSGPLLCVIERHLETNSAGAGDRQERTQEDTKANVPARGPLFSLSELSQLFDAVQGNVSDGRLCGLLADLFHTDHVGRELRNYSPSHLCRRMSSSPGSRRANISVLLFESSPTFLPFCCNFGDWESGNSLLVSKCILFGRHFAN